MSENDAGERGSFTTQPITTGELRINFAGDWSRRQALPEGEELAAALSGDIRRVGFSSDALGAWDTTFLAILTDLFRYCADRGIDVDRSGLPPGVVHLLTLAAAGPEQELASRNHGRPSPLHRIGTFTLETFRDFTAMLTFLGELLLAMGRLAAGRAKFQLRDLWLEIEEVGPRALLIVSVICFLVGLILAYLGADQLRMVQAQIYIADLVAIGMVREVGALMTGIIIAGRTGAAFAAQLGTMQVNEEIDALRTMGISPTDFLVLPRVLALMLMTPLLTLYASFVGILAGMVISNTIFGIGIFEYYSETVRALQFKHFLVGLSKGSVYGAVVAFSGCLRGMQCGRSAEAVGEAATSAVVTGILLITITASIMTIVYYQLGI